MACFDTGSLTNKIITFFFWPCNFCDSIVFLFAKHTFLLMYLFLACYYNNGIMALKVSWGI